MQYYINIRGAVEAPWLIGVMSFLFISVSVYMVTEILDIGNELWKLCIVSSIFVLNLTLINSAVVFIYLMDIYSLSLMFAVAAVFFLVKRKGVLGIIIASLCMGVSMGLYQSYLAVTIGMLMIYGIKALIDNEEYKTRKDIIILIIRMAATLAGGSIVYILLLRLVSTLTQVSAGLLQGNGAPKIGISELPGLITGCYKSFFAFFFAEDIYHSNLFVIVNGALLIIGIAAYTYILIAGVKENWKRVLILFALLLFPLGVNCFYIIMKASHLHYLMIFSYQLIYLLVVFPLLGDKITALQKEQKNILIILITILSFIVIRFGNDIFYYQKLVGDGSEAEMTNILYDIERCLEFDADQMLIVVIGEPREALANEYVMQQVYGMYNGLDDGTTITYSDVFRNYFRFVLGKNYRFDYSEETIDQMMLNEEVQEMPSYPKDGYIKIVNGMMIIKLTP